MLINYNKAVSLEAARASHLSLVKTCEGGISNESVHLHDSTLFTKDAGDPYAPCSVDNAKLF